MMGEVSAVVLNTLFPNPNAQLPVGLKIGEPTMEPLLTSKLPWTLVNCLVNLIPF